MQRTKVCGKRASLERYLAVTEVISRLHPEAACKVRCCPVFCDADLQEESATVNTHISDH